MNRKNFQRHWLFSFFLCLLFLAVALSASAASAPLSGLAGSGTRAGGATVEVQKFTTRVEYAREGKTTWAVLWLVMNEGYHVYAHDQPGSTGKPTVLRVTGADGKKTLPVFYPSGLAQRDLYAPSTMVRVYKGTTPLFVRLDQLKGDEQAKAVLNMLVCSAQNCQLFNTKVALSMPKDAPPLASQPWAEQWRAVVQGKGTDAVPPVSSVSSAPAVSPGKTGTGPGTAVGTAMSLPGSLTGGQGVSLAGGPSEIEQAGSDWIFAPRHVQEEAEVRGLGKALLLGLLAGLLLNCMPCVLPVLTLKASAMLVVGSGDKAERLHRFREHNVLFAAGILTQFLLLAVILGTAGLIWGQLFQSTTFVAAMLVVVFMLGLSMLGLFTLPVIDLKAGSTNSPRLQAFLTGIMATLLATPCSGPLLGGVLSWAFMQPLMVLIVVFLAVGMGMSIPYIIFAVRPELAVFLPRPGKWMEALERLVGFFLLGTSLYLLSILPQEQHMPLLAALLAVAVGGWVWGYYGGYDAPRWRRDLLGGALATLVVVVVIFAAHPPVQESLWEPFDAPTFRTELGKTPILVEFTADWCPNCKFLERTTLTPRRLRHWQEEYGLRLVRVDLTRPNPEAEALLQALGSSSIPLTAVFSKGLASSAPVVLRDIYSADTLSSTLRKVFR